MALVHALADMKLHQSSHKECTIQKLVDALIEKLALPNHFSGLFFVEPDALAEVKEFATSDRCRYKQPESCGLIFKRIDIYCVRLYGVFFQSSGHAAIDYAHITGVGISQSLAEYLHPHVKDSLFLDLSMEDGIVRSKPTYLLQIPASLAVKERIVSLLKRIPATKAPSTLISPKRPRTGDIIVPAIGVSDVYLFPTGKAALYRLHNYLTIFNDHECISVIFGCVSISLLCILAVNGARCKHFSNGDNNDLAALEALCVAEATADRRVQALYVEFSCASAFESLRKLADMHGFVLVVNDISANLASVDVMSIADVLVTDLARGFSADVKGGSIVLNPNSNTAYQYLKPLLERNWRNEVFAGDIVELEYGSRDYLLRSAISNRNAEAIATFLKDKVSKSSVTLVDYPKFSSGFALYMRDPTSKFVSGYGCLVGVEFEEQNCAVAFHTALKTEIEANSNDRATSVVLEDSGLLLRGDQDQLPLARRGCRAHVIAGLENKDSLLRSVQQALQIADANA
ncbi:hypothetical protein PISL3812_00335 [Talaromyces islandicus]|uniref:Cystathionine gamma-synthase n=1 Tax=Talaromyces islandicus TaxID=28573 RepID=A0A0U1LJ02_TALIS|nr:hypothetical protein PISL3812_00335 [Talaromyces islandicus]